MAGSRLQSTTMTDLLDPSALLHVLQQLLPSSEPQLRLPSDALSAMIHTIMTRLDFRLAGLSEDDLLPQPSSDESSSSSSDATSTNKLPAEWNSKGPDHYSFRYKHHQSSLDYLVKIVKLGNKAVIYGIVMQGSNTSTMEIPLSDYLSPSFFPYPHAKKEGERDEPLVNGFIGSSRLKDLVIAYKTQILQTLVPGLRKDGYTEESSSNTGDGRNNPSSSSSSTQPNRLNQPRRPFAGDEDDPTYPSQPSFRNPLTIGDRDLDPLGGSPLAMPPRFGGGGSSAPPPLFPGGDTGGGMLVGPGHPMFRDRFRPNHPEAGPTGLPPGAVPPGARFDPIYPSGGGPFGPDGNYPDVGGARPQGGRGGPASGEPDWDELAPPRGENPFGGGRGGRGGFGGGFGGLGGGGRGGPPPGGWYS